MAHLLHLVGFFFFSVVLPTITLAFLFFLHVCLTSFFGICASAYPNMLRASRFPHFIAPSIPPSRPDPLSLPFCLISLSLDPPKSAFSDAFRRRLLVLMSPLYPPPNSPLFFSSPRYSLSGLLYERVPLLIVTESAQYLGGHPCTASPNTSPFDAVAGSCFGLYCWIDSHMQCT